MEDLKKEYVLLFNGVSEVIAELEGLVQRLKLLQQAAENCYLDNSEPTTVVELEETVPVEQHPAAT
ncbi:hypothetical protein LJC49_04735 [Ruminococcaceae bacterium OttesenSCG-928-I18]|nr:hypothetical protein [Ruminococcaceae bacterium OttesenSCG-928-I18]